ncbi:MAG: hypothetical protein A2271_04215 [Candidatus Moranbacteria bacterium RIFOXYA12_FULL_35_19]|nr:MAG: hypothetical protein A2489_01220 [Candidatus Moranbacteria bacterium RIFOXYC12_FULL_36_13]OGI33231.1 MAG: hypothetical protein A2343_03240 [Candidatus Moranbacteria bacterium RIFOXYB12_FULL_35_8]OGI36886.1 MAG: hypothetical protein A2271_04215 [Candidatus Moranbacteria bacterium RIFOXYA12_FULL_35_19]
MYSRKNKPEHTKKRRLCVMKKKYLIVLAIIVGIFILPAISLATTFNLPSPVYVSGDVSGELYFRSENPAALDMIDGVIQFCNDTVKSRGWGMIKNAFRPAERINSKLLLVHLYQDTLATQFAFNVKHGSLWGLIPSCMLIPDNKTVIVEYSGPSRDSEDGNGGHHFSLIAGITDSSYYKAVGNIMPCPSGMVQPVEVPVQISPALAPVVQTPPTPAPVVAATSVAVAKTPAVKKPKTKKCDPCVEIAKVKADTEAIKASVGKATPEEEIAGLGDLHKKATKQLEVAEKTKVAIGEPTVEGETLMGVAKDIQEKVAPLPPKSSLEKARDYYLPWLIVGLCCLILLLLYRRQQPRLQ